MNRQLFEYHPVVGHRFVPGVKARITDATGAYLVQTNSTGFRDRKEFVRERQPRTVRALVFGDSFTAGDGLSNGARYTDLLEGLVPDLEVFNFGLSGSGTDQQYLIFREFARDLQYDVIVIGVFLDSIRRVTARYRTYRTQQGDEVLLAKPYFSVEPDGRLLLHHVPVPKEPIPVEQLPAEDAEHVYSTGGGGLARRMVERLGPQVKDQVQRLTRHQPFPAYDDPQSRAWLLLKGILLQWIDEVHVPVVILTIPFYRHIEGTASAEGYTARFCELHHPPRVAVCNPLDDFLQFPPTTRRGFRFENDPHMTAAGHEILAASLASVIRPLVADQRDSRR